MQITNVIMVIVVVAIVELAKKFIFKSDPKYKLIYTFSPIVLCAIGFLILAIINKTDIWSSILAGASLGFTCMGSYDAIATILKGWKTKTPEEIAKEVEAIIGDKKVEKK